MLNTKGEERHEESGTYRSPPQGRVHAKASSRPCRNCGSQLPAVGVWTETELTDGNPYCGFTEHTGFKDAVGRQPHSVTGCTFIVAKVQQ